MKTTTSFKSLNAAIIGLALAVSLLACRNPASRVSLPQEATGDGYLEISFAPTARAITPSGGVDIATIDLAGTGPNSASFSRTGLSVSSASSGRIYLATGSWSITAIGRNASGGAVAQGSATVTVKPAQLSTASIALGSLTGNGQVALTVTWPAGVVSSPALSASLTPASGGSDISLGVSADAANRTASLTGAQVAAGSYTLTVVMKDSESEVGRAVDAVVVAAGLSTTGTLAFAFDPLKGGLAVSISIGVGDPIAMNLALSSSMLEQGSTETVTAQIPGGVSIVKYQWYINGALQAETSGTLSFGSSLAPGVYRVDCVAFSSNNVGSAAGFVQVILPRAAAPTFSPAAGNVGDGTLVTMSSTSSGAKIYFTTDGSDPTESSTLYGSSSQPVISGGKITVKAIAVAQNCSQSLVTSGVYTSIIAAGDAIYVSSTKGDDSNPGSAASPVLTIKKGLELATAGGIKEVRVAAGSYIVKTQYGLPITSSISLKGGYNPADWTDRKYLAASDRSNVTYQTSITYTYPWNGTSFSDCTRAIDVNGDGAKPTIEGFTITPLSTGYSVGVYSRGNANPLISYNTFVSTSGSGDMSGVRAFDGNLDVENCVFNIDTSGKNARSIDSNLDTAGTNYNIIARNNTITVSGNGTGDNQIWTQCNGTGTTTVAIEKNTITSTTTNYWRFMKFYKSKGDVANNQATNFQQFIYSSCPSGDFVISNNILFSDYGYSDGNYSMIYMDGDNSNTRICSNKIYNISTDDSNRRHFIDGSKVYSITENLFNSVIDSYSGITFIGCSASYICSNSFIMSSSATNHTRNCFLANIGDGCIIQNNILFFSGLGSCVAIAESSNCNAGALQNNLFYVPAGTILYRNANSGFGDITDVDYTNDYATTTQDASRPASGNIWIDPSKTNIFVDTKNSDYHLAASAPTSVSQGGLDLSASAGFPKNDAGQPIDIEGKVRTAPWSMGAYEAQ